MTTKRELLEQFDGIPSHIGVAFGISRQAINSWGLNEDIPELRQMKWDIFIEPNITLVRNLICKGYSHEEIMEIIDS